MEEIRRILEKGGVIIYPTDTLYALGVDATNPQAVAKIFAIKKRYQDKGLSIAIGSVKQIEKYAVMTPLAKRLAEKFLPGPLTLVLEKKDTLAENLTDDNTVAIRVIEHPIFEHLPFPLTATSANISGSETLDTPQKILEQIGGVDRFIDDGPRSGVPSTIIDARGDEPVILREGSIRSEELQ